MKVMVNGLPGRMATKVAEFIAKSSDFELLEFSFTGPDTKEKTCSVLGKKISLLTTKQEKEFEKIKKQYFTFLAVDFTLPNAVNENVEFYCRQGISFVLGTTGGDRQAIEKSVKSSKVCAVIAPNLAKQVVAFQAMMKYAAETFPNAFKGFSLEIIESHQKGKADTSGAAITMIDFFNKLGIPFSKEQVKMVREPEEQLKMGIPESALSGHAWHTFNLKSGDGSVLFSFMHNINGREIYKEGALDALRFLEKKVKAGEKGKTFSMIDVLKGQ